MTARRTLALVSVGVWSILIASCMRHSGTLQEVATDLHNYTIEMEKWEPKETAIFQAIDDVEESQYTDDEFVLRTLKGTLPALDEHIREVAAYRPVTAELAQLHEHYVKGWEDLRAALGAMIAAETRKDYMALSKGKAQMVAARGLLLRAFSRMDALMEENEQTLKHMRKS